MNALRVVGYVLAAATAVILGGALVTLAARWWR